MVLWELAAGDSIRKLVIYYDNQQSKAQWSFGDEVLDR